VQPFHALGRLAVIASRHVSRVTLASRRLPRSRSCRALGRVPPELGLTLGRL